MIIQIVNALDNLNFLDLFLRNAGGSLNSFRYFSKRPLEVIQNHFYTILLLKDGVEPVGYGHLDQQDGIIWLGICVTEKYIGDGLGSLIMTNLLEKADSSDINQLLLQVDKDNTSALKLYQKFNFEIIEEKNGLYYLMKRVNKIGN